MKIRLLITIALLVSQFCFLDSARAADGDLVVNGNLCVGGKCTSSLATVPVWDYTVTGSPVMESV